MVGSILERTLRHYKWLNFSYCARVDKYSKKQGVFPQSMVVGLCKICLAFCRSLLKFLLFCFLTFGVR